MPENNYLTGSARDGRTARWSRKRPESFPINRRFIIERENARLMRSNNLPPVDISKSYLSNRPSRQIADYRWEHPELNDPGGEKIIPNWPANG